MHTAPSRHLPPSVHLEPIPIDRLRRAASCAWRVLMDSERTMDIVTAEEIVAQAQLRYLLERGVFDGPEGRELSRDRPDLAAIDVDALGELPAHTLGGALARFHAEHGLSTKIYDAPVEYTPAGDLTYLLRRIRHSHDIWHVLTNLGIEGHDEILLHSFSLAQTGLPSSVALMVLGSFKHMVLEARWGALTYGLREAHARGRRAQPLIPVYWEREWETPVGELRARLGIEPWTAADRAACQPWAGQAARA
jgi:ubiquinone biosynthesis protein COQ4